MKLGVCSGCTSLDKVELIAKTGFDYVEINFTEMVNCSDEEIDAFIAKLAELNFACEAANCFVPGSIPLTGDAVDYDAVAAYLEKGMERAGRIGIQSVVFGSSGARNVPEGFSMEKAYEQLVVFLRDYAGPAAKKHGVRIAVEPLTEGETNIIFTVEDGVMLARASGCDNVAGLGDLFHMNNNGDAIANIEKFKGEVIHSHVCALSRYYPLAKDKEDCKPFMAALKAAGCERASIEGRSTDFENDLPEAFAVLTAINAEI